MQIEERGDCFGEETHLAFPRLSEEPFHSCFQPNVSSAPLAVLLALGRGS